MSSFFDFRLLSKALSKRLLLLGCRSMSFSFGFSFSSWTLIETDFQDSEGYRCLSRAGFGVVDRLMRLGVVDLEASDPERKRGNRCGETDLLFCSFLAVLPMKEKEPGNWDGLPAGEVERPLLTNEGVFSLTVALTALRNCSQSSSSMPQPLCFRPERLEGFTVCPAGKTYLLWYRGVFMTDDCCAMPSRSIYSWHVRNLCSMHDTRNSVSETSSTFSSRRSFTLYVTEPK